MDRGAEATVLVVLVGTWPGAAGPNPGVATGSTTLGVPDSVYGLGVTGGKVGPLEAGT